MREGALRRADEVQSRDRCTRTSCPPRAVRASLLWQVRLLRGAEPVVPRVGPTPHCDVAWKVAGGPQGTAKESPQGKDSTGRGRGGTVPAAPAPPWGAHCSLPTPIFLLRSLSCVQGSRTDLGANRLGTCAPLPPAGETTGDAGLSPSPGSGYSRSRSTSDWPGSRCAWGPRGREGTSPRGSLMRHGEGAPPSSCPVFP